jgi:methylmalonyl-CoA epimerase
VAIAVPSIARALPTYELLTGGAASEVEAVPSQGVLVAFVGEGTGRIELIEPSSPESPVGRFLQSRGPGLHHLAYRVDDLENTLRQLEGAGLRLIDKAPRPGAHGRLVAFIHPESTGGILIELVQETSA